MLHVLDGIQRNAEFAPVRHNSSCAVRIAGVTPEAPVRLHLTHWCKSHKRDAMLPSCRGSINLHLESENCKINVKTERK
jgi:hypothetical protein